MKKSRFRIAVGLLIFLGLVGAYRFSVVKARQINYRIFNVEETVSWVEQETGIYRREAKGHLDNLLLSADAWRRFELSFDLYHPRDCGIIFHYRDPQTYHFLYFHQPTQSIFWACKTAQETRVIQRHSFLPQTVFPGRLEVTPTAAKLFLGGRLFSQVKIDPSDGPFGILINDADNPRTIFHRVTVQGTLSNGQQVAGASPPVYKQTGFGYLLVVLPSYLALLLAGFFLAWMVFPYCRGGPSALYRQAREKRMVNGWSAALVHFILAAVIFSPFLLRREIFVSSYDNLGEIYPLVFLSKHKFVEMMRTHAWSLWNPYFHNGTPFFSSHWNMIYYPLNWILFGIPDRGLMTALTLKTFIEVFLTGVLAYLFFAREIPSRTWALVSSVCYQLCSFLIFALSIYPTISLYFSMTLFLYWLWSMDSRRAVWNYLGLAIAVFMIMTSANIVFIFYALLALGVMTVHRWLRLGIGASRSYVGVTVAAGLTGLALSLVRIVPCIQAIMHSNRIVNDYYTIHDRLIMFVRLFIPEITGGFGPGSFNALTSPNLQLIFRQLDMPSNPQNAFFVYFGIIPAILLLASLVMKTRGSHRFWKVYAFGALAVGLLLQPFWGVLSILFFPLFHFSYLVIVIPVGVCALVGHTGWALEHRRIRFKSVGPRLIYLITIVLSAILVFWTYLFPNLTGLIRWIFILSLTAGGIYAGVRSWARRAIRGLSAGLIGGLNVLIWSLFFFAGTIILLKPIPRKELFTENALLPFLAAMIIVQTALILYGLFIAPRQRRLHPGWIFSFVLAVPVCMGLLFGHPLFRQIVSLPEGLRLYALDNMLALVRVLVIVQFMLWAFALNRLRRLPDGILRGLILLILAADLLIFNLRFDNITAPFYHKQAFYNASFAYQDIDPHLRQKMDLTNYRVHALQRAGLNANKNVIFRLPSYTGTLGYLSRRFSDFINRFGYPKGTILIYPVDIACDQRFLDLSAVRYTVEDEASISERPSALARMNLFYDHEVYPDSHALLERLGEKSFDHHQTVLLASEPDIVLTRRQPLPARPVMIKENSSDRITVDVLTEHPAILLFSESYHPGWRVFRNGTSVPVIRADFNFMACAVPAGRHTVIFDFRPQIFTLCLAISLVACACFILVVLVWLVFHRRFESRSAN